jgi:OOP family OmpA-OmpF porin
MKRYILTLFCSVFILINAHAQNYKLEGSEVKIDLPIVFESGSSILKPESDAALKIIKQYLDDKSYISMLRVEAHTDNVGDPAKNQALSDRRAFQVCMALIGMGVDCKRLIAVGFGGTKPVEDNSTPDGKAANRRISFVNVALRGHLIGGMPADGGGAVVPADICKQ